MRILYVSHLGSDQATGLCWSVPAGIRAQQLYDDCFWINVSNCGFDHWEAVEAFHRLSSIGKSLSLNVITRAFPNPDVVVFEGFYQIEDLSLAHELYKNHIPYIIVPRGSLTHQAFHNHSVLNFFKKKIAVILFFRRFTRRALAIQYLTDAECKDSGDRWNKVHFILPNGINRPERAKSSFSENGINIVYIGRPTIYHKGLDLLVSACKQGKELFEASGLVINCYVPQKNDYQDLVRLVKDSKIESVFKIHQAVFGEEKEKVLLCADVFIMTSRFEGHPMGLIEALSYGIPVAITPGTNMSNEVSRDNAGWVSSCTTKSIYEMIKQLITEKSQLGIKGRNAKNLSMNYEWDKLARVFHNKLLSLLNTPQ